MKILFDKVEVIRKGKYQGPSERKFKIPTNMQLEMGVVSQVGSGVDEIAPDDVILYICTSIKPVTGSLGYLRNAEVLFVIDKDLDEMRTLEDVVRVKLITTDISTSKGGLIIPKGTNDGVLKDAEVITVNSKKNKLNLKVGQKIKFHPNLGEKILGHDDSILLREQQIIYA